MSWCGPRIVEVQLEGLVEGGHALLVLLREVLGENGGLEKGHVVDQKIR